MGAERGGDSGILHSHLQPQTAVVLQGPQVIPTSPPTVVASRGDAIPLASMGVSQRGQVTELWALSPVLCIGNFQPFFRVVANGESSLSAGVLSRH